MIRSARRWIAIRRYVKRLGRELRERYRRAKRCTPAQVRNTIERRGYSTEWMSHALCMYCGRRDFDAYHRGAGESRDYAAMRREGNDGGHSGNGDETE
jgi:tRNA U38,U39,U40 pseudouridine synthase TruA